MPEELNVQAMDALVKANEVRSKRAQDKRQIRHGQLDPVQILERPPDHWATARIIELLLAMPRVGRQRAGKWLLMAEVAEQRQLATMPAAQRFRLAGYVRYGTQS
jgi:hypothetical protein